MTAKQLEELLGKVTQGEWRTTFRYKGVIADHDTGYDDEESVSAYGGHLICESVAWESNANLIALAPSLARKVIAAEKLVEASKILADIIDSTGEKPYAVADFDEALTAYREASK